MAQTELAIQQGKTFVRTLRWESAPIEYEPITAIAATAPVSLTVPGHGVPDGWRIAIVSVKGMTEINASQPPKAKDYQQATVVSTDTIEINKINASGYAAYTSGGFIQYNSPVPLDGYTARMAIKDKMRGNEYYRLTTENGDITIDVTGYKIELSISAEVTAGFTFLSGVYDLEMVSPDGVVSQLIYGEVTVAPEVTD